MPAIGIDIGTTHCRVSVLQDNKVKIIVDDQGNREIPCYVAFTDSGRLIGNAAKNQIATNPSNTIFDVKRLIGRKLNDENIQNGLKHWPFDLIDNHGELRIQVEFRGGKKTFRPYEVISMILKKVKETAEAFLGEEVKDAVISVPACFNYSQRQETKNAAEVAGLKVLRIINEPSAAILVYCRDRYFIKKTNFIVFDLGASKCDVSIITILSTMLHTGVSSEVKSTAGSSQLGGENFNSRLIRYLCERFRKLHGKDIKRDPRALMKLRIAAEQAKRTLSSSTEALIEINALYDGIDYYTKISRGIFEEICADLFRSTLGYVQEALVNANLDKKSIHDIILVGGSTHIPKIQSLLQNFFDVEKLDVSINSYEAVAYGAAVHATILTDKCNVKLFKPHQGMFLSEVVTSSLGIATIGGVMIPIIQRNQSFPCKETRRFKTSLNNQLSLSIGVFEGEQSMTENNKFIGQFELEGITLAPNLVPMIDITFDLDVNGTLRVTAVDAENDCDENIPTLVNFHPYKSIETKTGENC